MFVNVTQIANRSFIYTLMLLLCLSCPLKREIKHAFNIPVSQSEGTGKPNKTQFCQFTTDQSKKKTYNQAAKRIQLPDLHSPVFITSATTGKHSVTIDGPCKKVSIYIQNEQFLI
ncbi:hypothetical protein H9Y05_11185 [Crocinitomicaceae bacterium CZZ-1]|uniref:Uncharacterized protein n=1 Tax=Taishania pollutisoli TaxID=2766479 RepID=A0A8J6PDA3_9FLAO|nr:hypothetical protein [Taishania pollutisoli]MBC9813032.1 hypothetical protein [Taishania pollutisoli]MBX2948765.1 hypothetical protein [Crocinitomicaceae bacterium]NGF75732.1 hypothetical protein [Fluviicola sp. SGL-29]